ncbi:hypothetical protein NGA_0626400, partial [Nannochloropsis gaditana CCMP526]|uniref:uncharacterized protein n=1 Tax=Nannochloropsis gaditana (strain CCMP526) TaxID=1093141 RepID=UPI00029F7FF7
LFDSPDLSWWLLGHPCRLSPSLPLPLPLPPPSQPACQATSPGYGPRLRSKAFSRPRRSRTRVPARAGGWDSGREETP